MNFVIIYISNYLIIYYQCIIYKFNYIKMYNVCLTATTCDWTLPIKKTCDVTEHFYSFNVYFLLFGVSPHRKKKMKKVITVYSIN